MLERDYVVAEKILTDFSSEHLFDQDDPKTFYEGRTAVARGDSELAQRYFAATLPALEGAIKRIQTIQTATLHSDYFTPT